MLLSRFWPTVMLLACARSPHAPRTAFSDRLPNADKPNEMSVTKSAGVIGYSGKLTRIGLDTLKKIDDPSVHALMVRSPGGEVGIGMDFGEWVRTRGLDVIVVDYCVSSCANYVFPAGRNKTILAGGVVAWHGDVLQRGLHEDLVKAPSDPHFDKEAYFASMKSKQARFFADIGVSECLCRIGIERFGAHGFYSMSVADMGRFGVENVTGPQRIEDVAEDVREQLALRFVTVPPDLDARTACE